MALVINTAFYGITFGDAIFLLGTQLSSNSSNTKNGTLTIIWSASLAGVGPGFRATWTQRVNPATTVQQDAYVMGVGGATAPISWMLGAFSASQQMQITSVSGSVSADQVALALAIAVGSALADLAAATVNLHTGASVVRSGMTNPATAYQLLIATQGVDTRLWALAVVDVGVPAVGSNNWRVQSLVPPSAGMAVLSVPGDTPASSDVPFDLDVAINNGANMFSVMSKTFTEPGT